ncbi:molybdopterin oxidoreductase family protein [Thermostichus vulcanus]|uniref:Nitrate reductase n=1 Tax=Thermostichus vulcanus str. 'Rupite' TaxID=2813851 RepID=A0ABT0C6R4_THEVL|nr:nitrate reductase [Thermostichus vulcanus]MCJ2541487.1 nitrate reductase [Thermostichus vulcanus str. 'Rupite']
MSQPVIKTQCPYCGVGCGLEAVPTASGDWKIRGDRDHPSSLGMVCVKGATVMESVNQDRLLYPMFREQLDRPFRRISWEQAFDEITSRLQHLRTSPDAIAMYGSGQFLTEDYYVAQKLIKGCLGTNNFDANSRLCMSSAVSGYMQSLGSDGPPCCYEDLDLCDLAFLVGTNTAECHPILFNRLKKRHRLGSPLKMIVVDPRKTQTAEAADLHLGIRPGSDIDLFNGIAHLLLRWGEIDSLFIEDCTQGFARYAALLSSYEPETVAQRCGISLEDLIQAAKLWQGSRAVLSLWSMGLNQSSEGTAKICSLINLHLMTGQIGKPGMGPFSLTGQPNAMGGREAGGLSHLLPGYRSVRNSAHRADVETFWGLPRGSISAQPGLTATEMISALEAGSLKFFWIAATNPLVSLPDLERVKKALRKSPFTIYQEAYYPTETAEYAHLLLPACQWSEKTGVMTNSERRVTLCQRFQDPPGEARPDWEIFAEVGRRLGFSQHFSFQNAAEVYAEFVALTENRPCDHSGLSHSLLAEAGPQHWPHPKVQTQAKIQDPARLYTDLRFPTPDGLARFIPYHSRGLAEPPDPQYPFVLTTGRVYGHWHTQTRTGRIDKIIKMHPQPFIEIHPHDAEKLALQEGDPVQVRSPRGQAYFPAKITRAIAPGTVFVPMHWGSLWANQAECNALTHDTSCPASGQPELKACAVALRKAESFPSKQEIERVVPEEGLDVSVSV